jgi:hypothetical protein
MKKTLLVVLFGISNLCISQSISEIDSFSNSMCEYLRTLEIENDTLKIETLYQEKFYPYLNKIDEIKVDKVGQQVYYRLQRNCVEFRELLDRLDPPKEAVSRTTEKPKPKIKRKEIKEFKKNNEFYYFEASGETTTVRMENNNWTDSFSDNTVSELNYKWLNETEFELTFIRSDNETRKNLSVKGDKYVYQVLSKEDDYYLMSVNIPGQTVFEKFKLYY